MPSDSLLDIPPAVHHVARRADDLVAELNIACNSGDLALIRCNTAALQSMGVALCKLAENLNREVSLGQPSEKDDVAALGKGTYWIEWEHVRLILMCSLPGCVSKLRLLPPELLAKVGRCAYRPRDRPVWDKHAFDPGLLVTPMRYELSRSLREQDAREVLQLPVLVQPASASVQYYVFECNGIHFGTQLDIAGLPLCFVSNHAMPSGASLAVTLDGRHVDIWDEIWEHSGLVSIGILLDRPNGTLTLSLNGIVGPRLQTMHGIDGHLIDPHTSDWFADSDEFPDGGECLFLHVMTPRCVPCELLHMADAEHGMCDDPECFCREADD